MLYACRLGLNQSVRAGGEEGADSAPPRVCSTVRIAQKGALLLASATSFRLEAVGTR